MKKRLVAGIIIGAILLSCSSSIVAAHDEHDIHSELFKTVVIKDGMDLDIIKCVALAFQNSPKIKHHKYQLDLAKSNVGMAKSAFFPVIGAGVGFYNQNNSNSRVYDQYYRELPNVAVTVNQLVWDFGKSTANIKMEEFYKIGAEYEFVDSLCSTLFDVKTKYYDVLKAQADVVVAEDNVKICEKYLKIAKGAADKTTASFQLSRAYFDWKYKQTLFENAKVNLSNAMFVENVSYNLSNTSTFNYEHDYGYEKQKHPDAFKPYQFSFPKSKAVEIAYSNSPDLKVLESTRNAMEQNLKYIKRTYLPELSANAGYGFVNNTEASTNHSLQVGVNLSTSVNLMNLKHSIKGADAQLNIADNEINLFKKDLYFEVQRAFNNVEFAMDDVPYAQATAVKALDNLNLVEKQYLSGQLNYVAILDARKDYITAANSYITSLYFYNKSLIQVEEALHCHLVDIHHKGQHAMTNHADELLEHLNDALNCEGKEKPKKGWKKSKDNL